MFGEYESLVRYLYGAFNGRQIVIALCLLAAAWLLMRGTRFFLFRKAGEQGWKSLVPLYGAYVFYRAMWKKRVFWLMLGLFAALAALLGGWLRFHSAIGSRFGAAGFAACALGALALFGALMGLEVFSRAKAARAFGRSQGFAAGLAALPLVFFPILAFGKSAYAGKAEGGAGDEKASAPSGVLLSWLPAALCALAVLAQTFTTFTLAFSAFSFRTGLFGSPYSGFANVMELLKDSDFSLALRTGALQKAADLALAGAFALGGALLGARLQRAGKALLLGVGAFMAFAPSGALESALAQTNAVSAAGASLPILLAHALPYAGSALLVSLLLSCARPDKPVRAACAALAVLLIGFFLHTAGASEFTLSGVGRQAHLSLYAYLYDQAFVGTQFGKGAAAEAAVLLLSVIPAAWGAVALGALGKDLVIAPVRVRFSAKRGLPALAAALALCALGAAACFALKGDAVPSQTLTAPIGRTLLNGLLGLLAGFLLSFVLLLCLRRRESAKSAPIAALAVLAALCGRCCSAVVYLGARELGWLNHSELPSVYAALAPFSVALALGLALLRPQKIADCALCALGAALLTAVYAMAETSAGMILIGYESRRNLGVAIVYAVRSGETAKALGLSGVLLALAGVPMALGAWILSMRDGKK